MEHDQMASELDRSYQMVGRILESLVGSGLRRVRLEADDFEMDGDGRPYSGMPFSSSEQNASSGSSIRSRRWTARQTMRS